MLFFLFCFFLPLIWQLQSPFSMGLKAQCNLCRQGTSKLIWLYTKGVQDALTNKSTDQIAVCVPVQRPAVSRLNRKDSSFLNPSSE